jgi:aspartate kinase
MGSDATQSATPIVVHKYGGSSVADVERLKLVAKRVCETVKQGYRVVVVISAMGHTTDELLALSRAVSDSPSRRELDMLVTAGERISSALLAMAIEASGQPAISFTGSQCGIVTSHQHSNARIVEVRPYRVQDELDAGRVVIIAGFQGVSYKREITTLGRGGSDTTAVAMAAALGAERCEICSDVDGVYSADPRVVDCPEHLAELGYDEMQELSLHGAQVLNAEAVEFAKRHGIVIYARATAGSDRVTRITGRPSTAGAVGVAGLSGLLVVRGERGAEQLALIGRRLAEAAVAPLWARLDAGRPVVVLDSQNVHDIEGLERALTAIEGVSFERSLEAATVVGQGVSQDPGYLEQLIGEAMACEAEVIGVDTAPSRLTLLLRPGKLDEVQRALHRRFIEEVPTAADDISAS